MSQFIYDLPDWPKFRWDSTRLAGPLAALRHRQGRLLGRMEWFLGCLDRAFNETEKNLGSVLGKARFWETHAHKSFNDRQRLMLNKLLDGFDGKLNSSKWATISKCSQDTALRDILDLVERGVLAKDSGGGRSTSYSLATADAQPTKK